MFSLYFLLSIVEKFKLLSAFPNLTDWTLNLLWVHWTLYENQIFEFCEYDHYTVLEKDLLLLLNET